ncbi:MAG: hypothetical protein AAFX92_06175 [Pseudomonadota bacterium]
MIEYEAVDLTLGDDRYTLEATPRVARTLNRAYSGLLNIMDRVRRWDIDVVVDVINVGSGLNYRGAKRDALWDAVYTADRDNDLAEKVVEFVALVITGGRRPGAQPGDGTGDAAASGEGKP